VFPKTDIDLDLNASDPNADSTRENIIQAFLRQYKERRDELDADGDIGPQPLPAVPRDWIANHRIEWREMPYPEQPDTVSLKFARHDMRETLRRYMLGKDAPDHALLIRGSAGLGKTHTGVSVAQEAAALGLRVLWASARHDSFHDLRGVDGFDAALWYNWLPIHKDTTEEGTDPIGTTCRYAPEQHTWSARGYRTFDLCKQLCITDGHIADCRYRNQSKQKQPIVFARHNHLYTGLSVANFDIVIVDEWPAQAFIHKSLIPTDEILVKGAEGAVHHFMAMLESIAESNPKQPYSGKKLFDEIGPYLERVYAELNIHGQDAPVLSIVPQIMHPGEVSHVPYFYIFDFLILAMQEFRAWQAGWDEWAERIEVWGNGLTLLSGHQPWEDLPGRLIAFDATGTKEFYEPLFKRQFETYRQNIERIGTIKQVTGRQNGIGALIETPDKYNSRGELAEAGTLTDAGREEIEKAAWIASQYEPGTVGVITHLGMKSHAAEIVGWDNVLHFRGNRGSNSFEDMQCLIVLGNPEVPPQAITDMASVLYPARIEKWGVDGAQYELTQFHTTRAFYDEMGGLVPFRRVFQYPDEKMQIIHEQFREMELHQSLHRARPNVSDCDIWILNSTPCGEALDGIYDRLPIGPDGIQWGDWFKIEKMLDEKLELGESVTVEDIANVTGRSKKYIQNKKWLQTIGDSKSDEWTVGRIDPLPGTRGGRPFTALKGKKEAS